MKLSQIKRRLSRKIFKPRIRVYIEHYYCDICDASPCGKWDYHEVVPKLRINEHLHIESCPECAKGMRDFNVIHKAKHYGINKRYVPYLPL